MDFALATELYPDEYWYHSDASVSYESEFDLIKIVQQLHASLDPRTVFACFGKIVGQSLPIKGIQLTLDNQKFTWGRRNGLEMQRVIKNAQYELVLTYQLSTPMNVSQTNMLAKIESFILQPFNNAVKYQTMSNQAMFDSLTKLGNRHYYRQAINHALARTNRKQGKVSLIVIDIDKFKQLNDQFGHQVGDHVLSEFAELLNQAIRNTDQAFRVGGDEFIIIAQGDTQAAMVLCQRILDAMPLQPTLTKYDVKCSLGVAQAFPKQQQEDLYFRADKAMYAAKAAGRNCYRICDN